VVAYIFMLGIYSAFHFITLEEYYSGVLYLGPFNGVSDGLMIVLGLTTTCIFTGNNFLATPMYDISWMRVEGCQILTAGQIGCLIIGVTNILLSFKQ
jgi:hypothetical protein